MRVELTDDPAVFRTSDWTDLVRSDPDGTFFHTPAYLKLWWEEFGSGRLALALAREDGRTVAACALEVIEGTLAFLGGSDVTDYMGPVGLPGLAEPAAKELLRAVTGELEWSSADLRGMPSASPWYAGLESAAGAHGLRVERGDDGVCPVIALPSTFQEYLGALPSKLRHEIRRKERRLRGQLGEYGVRVATDETLAADYDRFIDLHRGSPGPKGKFMHAGMEIFFRRLGEAFLPSNIFRLAFLEVEGRPAAAAIGFAYESTFSLYNSAFDREFASLSPGMVLVADLIARAIEQGRSTFDLLKGDLDYKYRFGPRSRDMGRLVLER
jgi:CelD/BcsL family acetyltransferase involved in cellulose biosynthesis